MLPVQTHISLAVYDHLGQKVAQLEEGIMNAGGHPARLDATNMAAGIYMYSLNAVDAEGKPVVLTGNPITAR